MQQDAQKLTEKREFQAAIDALLSSISLIDNIIDSTDDSYIIEPLRVFKLQINDRISDLQTLKSKPLIISPNLIDQTSRTTNVSSIGETTTNVKLLNYMLNEIRVSFIKNINWDITNIPKHKTYKIPFIDKDKISHLEHSLQLMTIGGGNSDKDIKLKNDYLSQLNALYYTELRSCQDCLSDIISVLKADTDQISDFNLIPGVDSDSKENTIIADPQNETIGKLQRRVNSLEREKIQMEIQIVKLKERWNGLVESARKRKESQSKTNQKINE